MQHKLKYVFGHIYNNYSEGREVQTTPNGALFTNRREPHYFIFLTRSAQDALLCDTRNK